MSRTAWPLIWLLLLVAVAACPDSNRDAPRRLEPPPKAGHLAPEDDLPKLFAEKVRSIELERQVAPVFEGALGAGTFKIECRGDICKVRSTAHEWWKTVQFDRTVRARTSDMLFWGADVYVRAKSPAS